MEEEPTYWNVFIPSLLDRLSFHMRKNITAAVEEYGINSSHALYLLALYIQDGQTLTGLSRFLDIDNANTTRMIKVLTEKGMVYDDRENEKSRKYHIYLTPKGHYVTESLVHSINEMNKVYRSGLTDEQLANAQYVVLKILNNAIVGYDVAAKSPLDKPYYKYMKGSK